MFRSKCEFTTHAQDGFDISVKNIGCQGFTVGSYSANMAGSVGITLGGIGVQCSGDWSFKLHIWPHIPGV
jgi:hypothetical protein